MLPCQKCSFRRSIPGDAHTRCAAFEATEPEKYTTSTAIDKMIEIYRGAVGGPEQLTKWFGWPANFDPCWGPNECSMRQEEYKGKMQKNTEIEMAGLLMSIEGIGIKFNIMEKLKRQIEANNAKAKTPPPLKTSGEIEL
jgi:hypothetical protein